MSTTLLKAHPDHDLYLLRSESTDNVLDFGTRAQLIADDPYDELTPQRFERADATGTSNRLGKGNWEDNLVLVAAPFEELRAVPRANLLAFVRALTYRDLGAMESAALPADAADLTGDELDAVIARTVANCTTRRAA